MLALAAALAAGVAGCATSKAGAKPAGDGTAAADSPVALRQEVDRLRADLAELGTRLDAAQRAGTEHADRTAQETRAEFDAVRQAMEASSRHDLQRQVEVLDAQARRVDLLERRVSELSQTLRRVELGIGGIESQLARMLEGNAQSGGARGGSAPRATEPRTGEEPRPAAQAGSGAAAGSAAGAGLTPPAMLGPSRPARQSAAPAPTSRPPAETKADSSEDSPPAKTPDTARTTPARPSADPAPRVAKAAPPPAEAKAPSPEAKAPEAKAASPVGKAPPADGKVPAPEAKAAPAEPKAASPAPAASRPSRPGAPAPGPVSARALFDRAMESWNKGEHGQAVLDFDELVQTFPSDPLAAAAQFRIGEAYFAARDFERATVEYRKAVDLAPKGKDTPQALLRLGLAYRAQKREADARQAWNQLVRDFPDSEASEEARRALRGR
jgi:tol-pal system protein YbgF